MIIKYVPKFQKSFEKIPLQIKKLAVKKEKVFRNEPFHPSLKTHKLNGEFEGFFAFSVNYEYRIIFQFKENKEVWFHNIGNHDIYE